MKPRALALVLILFAGAPSAAQKSGGDRDTLRGLTAFYPLIAIAKQDSVPLDKSVVSKQVVKKLIDAKVQILTRKEWEASRRQPLLFMAIYVSGDRSIVTYHIRLEVIQKIVTLSDPPTVAQTQTWSKETISQPGFASLNDMLEDADILIKGFLEDLEIANTPMLYPPDTRSVKPRPSSK